MPGRSGRKNIYYAKDNGIGIKAKHYGIKAKHYDQIIKMFRCLYGMGEDGGGAGAGLTIVKRLVERHRGRVWLDSCPGEGTTYYFTLCSDEEASDGHRIAFAALESRFDHVFLPQGSGILR
jgi:light-regulated signal transduction histidine kinase (bacteriophytochrome)